MKKNRKSKGWVVLTLEVLRLGATNGREGWSSAQMGALRLKPNDMTKGWLGRLVGRVVPEEWLRQFLALSRNDEARAKSNGKFERIDIPPLPDNEARAWSEAYPDPVSSECAFCSLTESLLDRACGALADIAYSTDLGAEEMRRKAHHHYESIRGECN